MVTICPVRFSRDSSMNNRAQCNNAIIVNFKIMKTKEIYQKVDNLKMRSAWGNGVKWYALYLLAKVDSEYFCDWEDCEKELLNGARTWKQYSEGGCALICDEEIAKILCSPSELKRVTRKDGTLRDKANKIETWLDVQARALYQAYLLIKSQL